MENKQNNVLMTSVAAASLLAAIMLPAPASAWCGFFGSCKQESTINQTYPVTINSTTRGHTLQIPVKTAGMPISFADNINVTSGAKAVVKGANNAPLTVAQSISSGANNSSLGVFLQVSPTLSGDVHSANGGSTTGSATSTASTADPIAVTTK